MSVHLVYDGAQLAVPEGRHSSRIAGDDDKIVSDGYAPNQGFLSDDFAISWGP